MQDGHPDPSFASAAVRVKPSPMATPHNSSAHLQKIITPRIPLNSANAKARRNAATNIACLLISALAHAVRRYVMAYPAQIIDGPRYPQTLLYIKPLMLSIPIWQESGSFPKILSIEMARAPVLRCLVPHPILSSQETAARAMSRWPGSSGCEPLLSQLESRWYWPPQQKASSSRTALAITRFVNSSIKHVRKSKRMLTFAASSNWVSEHRAAQESTWGELTDRDVYEIPQSWIARFSYRFLFRRRGNRRRRKSLRSSL